MLQPNETTCLSTYMGKRPSNNNCLPLTAPVRSFLVTSRIYVIFKSIWDLHVQFLLSELFLLLYAVNKKNISNINIFVLWYLVLYCSLGAGLNSYINSSSRYSYINYCVNSQNSIDILENKILVSVL